MGTRVWRARSGRRREDVVPGGGAEPRTAKPRTRTRTNRPNPSEAARATLRERKGPLSPLRNKLKMPPLPIPDRLRRIRLPPRPPHEMTSPPSANGAREAPAAVPRQLRRDARAGELDGAGVHRVRFGRGDARRG